MYADKGKIVVADDDEALLNTLTMILRERGYEVIPVSDPETLIPRLADERPDLLMLDILMPKIDGLELLKQVKIDGRWHDLPVLMISSVQPEDGTVQSLGLGASDFIPKPFRVKELVARVDAHLRTGRALRQAREEAHARAAEAKARADEAAIRAEMVDILHEVTETLKPEEIYHILARRVAHVLHVARCSLVIAEPDDEVGVVVVSSDNPMVRNLEIRLDRYPEVRKALTTNQPVLVADVQTDPLYTEVRELWQRQGIQVATKSAITIPFSLRGAESGVVFLRTVDAGPVLTRSDVEFAEEVVRTSVNAIEVAYQLETVESDKERYRWLANTDALTGCLNRRALLERLERELDRVQRYGGELSVLLIDLDRFKRINDSHGHLVGDSVLQEIGELFREEVRSVDISARYGGEEFLMVLPETGLDGALRFAERLRQRVEDYEFVKSGKPLRVTVSIGVATVTPLAQSTPEALIALADVALYGAKNDGRNLVRS